MLPAAAPQRPSKKRGRKSGGTKSKKERALGKLGGTGDSASVEPSRRTSSRNSDSSGGRASSTRTSPRSRDASPAAASTVDPALSAKRRKAGKRGIDARYGKTPSPNTGGNGEGESSDGGGAAARSAEPRPSRRRLNPGSGSSDGGGVEGVHAGGDPPAPRARTHPRSRSATAPESPPNRRTTKR